MPEFKVMVWWNCVRRVTVEAESVDDIDDNSIIKCVKGERTVDVGKPIGDIKVGDDYVVGSFGKEVEDAC